MADEVSVNMPPGGNGMNLRVGNKALGITGPIVIPVICIALVGVMGWIRSGDFKNAFALTHTHLQALRDRQEVIRLELQEQTKEIVQALQQNRDITGSRLAEQNVHLQEQSAAMRKHHAIIIFNQRHDLDQHLTLDLDLPASQK